MLISISGRKQSGKDLVGKIIQYLTGGSTVYPFDLNIDYSHKSNWQVKKFASTLKEIVSILTGFKVEDLEKEEIKNANLFPSYKLINKRINTVEVFSSMEDLVERLNHLRSVYLEVYSEKELDALFEQETVYITPRLLLQTIGTDIVRTINPEIWVNSLMSEYKPYLTSNYPVDDLDWEPRRIYPNWIITDLRFSNELEAVKKRGGITIRVNRNLEESKDQHESETELDNAEFDYVIDNNSDIQSLIEKVREILIKEKLL